MFSLFKKKPLLTAEESAIVVEAIRKAERQTSGEIRVFVESRCRFIDPLDRARELFMKLEMDETEHRNGTLLYVAIKDKQLAIFADAGIHQATGQKYWEDTVAQIISFFNAENYALGLSECVRRIGDALRIYFPFDGDRDKNELPDEIIFGN